MSKKNISNGRLAFTLAAVVGLSGLGISTLVGFEDVDGANDILKNELHLDEVKITGKGAFSQCLGSTQFRTAFTAKSNGYDVSGTVCDSWLKPAKVNFKTPSIVISIKNYTLMTE